MPHAQKTCFGVLALLATGVTGCGDSSGPTPTPDPVRTILFYSVEAGQNFLMNTDGSDLHVVHLTSRDSAAPIAVSPGGQAVALLSGNVIVLSSLTDPGRVDTMINLPAGSEISVGAFSPDRNLFGVVSYRPTEALLVYDRAAHRLDTLPVSGANTALPPAFNADGNRVALIGATQLALYVTVVQRDRPDLTSTSKLGISRFTHRPLFGWPLWTAEGLLLAVVHVADPGPDTVLSVSIDPAKPDNDLVERYRAVLAPVSDERPELEFGDRSTYAYGAAGEGLVLGAQPGSDPTRHAIYYVSRAVPRVRLVFDRPSTFPEFPFVIN
jgi:hypothetical protein